MQENYGLTTDMVDDYINCDADVPTKCENDEMNQIYDDVVAEFITDNGDADNDDIDDDDDVQEPTITTWEVMDCMAKTRQYLLSKNLGHLLDTVDKLQNGIAESAASSVRQRTLDSFSTLHNNNQNYCFRE